MRPPQSIRKFRKTLKLWADEDDEDAYAMGRMLSLMAQSRAVGETTALDAQAIVAIVSEEEIPWNVKKCECKDVPGYQ